MSLEEKLAKRKTEKEKHERFVAIVSLITCWSILIPMSFHLLVNIQLIQAMDLSYRDRVIKHLTELWWILIPMLVAYYQIKRQHRALGL